MVLRRARESGLSPGNWWGVGSVENGAEGQNAEEVHVQTAAGTAGGGEGAGWTEPGDPMVSRGAEEGKQP